MSATAEQRLQAWNALPVAEAAGAILPCNGSRAWAQGVAAQRPFSSVEALLAASDKVWSALDSSAWQQAFDSHPRIGEAKAVAATAQSLTWSHGEQAAAQPDEAASTALRLGNKAYEQRFGRIFIVCATGKSAYEMLQILERRLKNDDATELHAAAEEQRKITGLRLRKWLAAEAVSSSGNEASPKEASQRER